MVRGETARALPLPLAAKRSSRFSTSAEMSALRSCSYRATSRFSVSMARTNLPTLTFLAARSR
jgi:hypothetical protein